MTERRPSKTCQRGHPKVDGSSGCAVCRKEAGQRRRQGLPPAPKTHFLCGHLRAGNEQAQPNGSTCAECARQYRRKGRADRQANYRRKYPEKHRRRNARYLERLRDRVTRAYGGACAVCGKPGRLSFGKTDSLHLDHINGGGGEHREQLFGHRSKGGIPFYRWVEENGYPKGQLQLLCEPCHTAKSVRETQARNAA